MTVRITTPAAQIPKGSAPANLDSSSRRRGGAGKQRQAHGAMSSLQRRLPEWLLLEGPRKFAINGLVIIASMLGAGVVLKDALKQVAVIDTISVPKDLEADGYTPATMGNRIIDAVTQISRDAAMTRRIGIYTLSEVDPLEPESADYESPGRGHSWGSASAFTLTSDEPLKKYDVSVGGLSLTTVILQLRELFGVSDTRISGEITAEHPSAAGVGGKDEKSPPKKFSIRLRISDKGHVQYEAEADKLETLVEQAALKLVERFQPLEAAYYSYCKRDYDNALRIVRAYLAKQTKNERQWALNLLGLIEHARYEYDEARAEKGYNNAIAVFTELRTSDPKFASALYNLSFVLIDKGKKHLKDKDGEVARALLSQAYEVAREGIAINEAAAKRPNSISLVLSGWAADRTARELAVGYATAGRALRFLGQLESANYDQALRYFDRSIGADTTFMYAYFSQGAIHNEREAHDNAIARYQLATEISPSAQIFTRAGAYLRKYERHIDSIQMFQKAAELKPSANAYAYWGMALRASGRPEEARERFQRAIDTDPSSPNGYNQLGLMYLEQQKWDEAVENFLQAIRLSPQWSNYYYNLSRAFRGAGKVKEATDAMKKAIEIYKSHPKARMELEELKLQQRGAVVGQTARTVEEN
jgi:tetratricopeptide (TPR) repeat protein